MLKIRVYCMSKRVYSPERRYRYTLNSLTRWRRLSACCASSVAGALISCMDAEPCVASAADVTVLADRLLGIGIDMHKIACYSIAIDNRCANCINHFGNNGGCFLCMR